MRPARLKSVVGFGIDRVAAQAGADPDVLRLENLDTDLAPPPEAVEATRQAVGTDEANSYLPFIGQRGLREAVAGHLLCHSGVTYDPDRQIVITSGGTEGLLAALMAILEPGDEVLLTDPTYAGMIHRVTLAGGVPVFVPLRVENQHWRLNLAALRAAVSNKTRALFLMNPSMPSGVVLNEEEWEAVRELCVSRGLWLLYNAAMERLVYDGQPVRHPASLPGLAERTLVVGSVSKEYRMIGWRIGWVAGPPEVMADIVWTHTYVVVTPPGISQRGAEVALRSEGGVAAAVAEWQRRRDTVVEQLAGLPLVIPDGGWSLLVDVESLGLKPADVSALLLTRKVAATPMTGWGGVLAGRHVRLVFSNEPVERLATLRARLRGTVLDRP
jgi:aspartate/methionine/tyrosine aminotransferase